MKHEYHLTISRTDRIWLIVFVSALLGWELIKPLLPHPHHAQVMRSIATDTDTSEAGETKTEIKSWKKFPRRYNYDKEKAPDKQEEYSGEGPSPIHIMEATWKDLRRIGLSAKVASNIERYVAAGGVITNKNQLLKIYGMDSLQWIVASPFIIFPEVEKRDIHQATGEINYEAQEQRILDLNSANAADLEALPGIGTVLAERIIKYRNSLGGFISVAQVGECYGMPPETLEKIIPRLTVTTAPTLVNLNTTDLKQLTHPYVNRKMLKIIEAYRAQHGKIDGPSALRKIYPPDTSWCDKILPYLVFD